MEGAWYFVTSSTVSSIHIFASDEHLYAWTEIFIGLVKEFRLDLAAWVILSNHYHLLFKPDRAAELGVFMKRLNGITSRTLNLLDHKQGRTVWYSCWDRCMRDENDFWTRFNYIHENPVKHSYVSLPEDWKFSSRQFYLQNDEDEWLQEKLIDFPVLDLLDDDKF